MYAKIEQLSKWMADGEGGFLCLEWEFIDKQWEKSRMIQIVFTGLELETPVWTQI